MQRILSIIIAFSLSLLFDGCKEKDPTPSNENHALLIGNWKVVSARSQVFYSDGTSLGEDPVLVVENKMYFTISRMVKGQSSWPYIFEEKGGKTNVVITYPDKSQNYIEITQLDAQYLVLVTTTVYPSGGKNVFTEKFIRQ